MTPANTSGTTTPTAIGTPGPELLSVLDGVLEGAVVEGITVTLVDFKMAVLETEICVTSS